MAQVIMDKFTKNVFKEKSIMTPIRSCARRSWA